MRPPLPKTRRCARVRPGVSAPCARCKFCSPPTARWPTWAGGRARTNSASAAIWSATRLAVTGPQPATIPARTALARSTVVPQAGQKT
eukprot:3244788-Alexandrium_andersonii.AAC.1